jgi:hypothetical protein
VPNVPQSPAPSTAAAARVLRQGTITVGDGRQASLATGEVGANVENPDFTYNSDFGDNVSASSGRIASNLGASTPDTCADKLARFSNSKVSVFGAEGGWLCLATSDGHIAGMQVVRIEYSPQRMVVHYIVWDKPVPPVTGG